MATFVAHVRRLSASGDVLYVRIAAVDVRRLGLTHGQPVELHFEGMRLSGIVKTSGGSPWLAPSPGGSNGSITSSLRGAGFEHGMDVSVTLTRQGRDANPTSEGRPTQTSGPPLPSGPRLYRTPSTKIDPGEAASHIRLYNATYYRGHRNVDLDRDAFSRFRHGLATGRALAGQLAFVGEEYGGVQRRFLPHSIREEAAIVSRNISRSREVWEAALSDAPSLISGVPSDSIVHTLVSPFWVSRRWTVWASKVLHFLRPEAFPILDSKAKKALGLASLGASSKDYHRFCSGFRESLNVNSGALDAARREDRGESPTDLKLLDKILFQIGKGMS